MSRRKVALFAGLLSMLIGATGPASADPIEIRARFVRPDGSTIAGMPVRVVLGSEADPRSSEAGERLKTDTNGAIRRMLDARVKKRRISLDNMFIYHPSRLIEVGVEMELRGRPALYWIELDLVRDGAVGVMNAFVENRGGKFDRPLTFHKETFSWSIPDDPEGLLMSSIGAELRAHDMTEPSESNWIVDLLIEKHEFMVR